MALFPALAESRKGGLNSCSYVRVQAAAGQAPSHRVDLVRLHAQTVVVFPSGPTWDHVLLSLHGIRVEQVWNGVLRRGFAFRGEDHDKVAAALTAVGVDVVDDIMARVGRSRRCGRCSCRCWPRAW